MHTLKTIPTGLTPQAQRERRRYLNSYAQRVKKILATISLTVLVWGPDPNLDTAGARKRWQIKVALEKLGHNAMFSEEIDPTITSLDREDVLLELLETAQALGAHFVIVLLDDDSRGVIVELNICKRLDVASKVLVMVPMIFKGGFVHQSALTAIEGGNGAVYWYTDVEMDRCNVLTTAIHRVEQRRSLYALQKL